MGAEEEIPHTPLLNPIQIEAKTPRTIRIACRNFSAVRRGEMDQTQALFEGGKGIGGAYAENQALKMEKEARDRADGLDSAVRGKRRKATFPRASLWSQFTSSIMQKNLRRGHGEKRRRRRRRSRLQVL